MPAISITALYDPVSIVHIPILRAAAYASKLYWTIDRASTDSSEFFNLTSNRIEIALFASAQLIHDEWAADHHSWDGDDDNDNDGRGLDAQVKVHAGTWRVFEISSGDDGGECNYDSPHLRHVSAPLARAGISILYQSSYFADFLLVKSSDFDRAASIFASCGWHLDPLALSTTVQRVQREHHVHMLSPSPPLSPSLSPSPSPSPTSLSQTHIPPIPEISVLPSPLACVGLSHDAELRAGDRVRKFLVWPERATTYTDMPSTDTQQLPSSSSHSASSASSRPFLSYTRTCDGASVLTEIRVLRAMFAEEADRAELLSAGELDLSEGGFDEDDGEHEESRDGDERSQVAAVNMTSAYVQHTCTPSSPSSPSMTPLSPSSPSIEAAVVPRTPPMTPPTFRLPRAYSLPNTPKGVVRGGGEGRVGRDDEGLSVVIPIHWTAPLRSSCSTRSSLSPKSSSSPRTSSPSRPSPAFSLDLGTPWASADSSSSNSNGNIMLHGVNTHGLEHVRTRSHDISACLGPGGFFDVEQHRPDSESDLYCAASTDDDDDDENNVTCRERTKRCLQLDMRGVSDPDSTSTSPTRPQDQDRGRASWAYHLDKSGLVTLFSDLLTSANVRMLYSSTTHTANILVEARDVRTAERLLLRGGSQQRASSPAKYIQNE